MFSQVSVCPQGGSAPLHAQMHTPRQTPPRPPGQTPIPPGQTPIPPGQTPPRAVHAGIRSTSGRYASHWNAFLFNFYVDFWPSTSAMLAQCISPNVQCTQMYNVHQCISPKRGIVCRRQERSSQTVLPFTTNGHLGCVHTDRDRYSD